MSIPFRGRALRGLRAGLFLVTYTRGAPMPKTRTLNTVLVVKPSLKITTPVLPEATAEEPYSFQMAASGGKPPYQWSATGLPAGVAINPAGLVAGTPVADGSFPVAVTVTDSGA